MADVASLGFVPFCVQQIRWLSWTKEAESRRQTDLGLPGPDEG
jgi:hypothetical protein